MDIIDWFQHDALELPRSRTAGDFGAALKEILEGYLKTTAALVGSDSITRGLRTMMPNVSRLCEDLVEGVGSYLDGFPYRAYGRVQSAFGRVTRHFEQLASLADVSDALQYLYRIRLVLLR